MTRAKVYPNGSGKQSEGRMRGLPEDVVAARRQALAVGSDISRTVKAGTCNGERKSERRGGVRKRMIGDVCEPAYIDGSRR